MAEAMELDLSLNQPGTKPLDAPIVPPIQPIVEEDADIPESYKIDNYYGSDQLGSDILKQKYLAPWERHPYQLWKRQAIALASQ